MKKHIKWILFPAILGMGFNMPSCPGQKEMQDKIDLLQTQNADLAKKIQALTTKQGAQESDMNQVKDILPKITGVIEEQKKAIDRVDARVTEIETKVNKGKKKK